MIGDSVNLDSRLEGLSKVYGVDIVVSESTKKQAKDFAWQEPGPCARQRQGQAVSIFWPMAPLGQMTELRKPSSKPERLS